MSHSFSNNFVIMDDKYYRNREAIPTFQPTSYTTKAVTTSTNTGAPSYYRADKAQHYHEPHTSTSLGSYKNFSPYKVEPAPDTLETMKKLVEFAIQNKWTRPTLDSHWQQFVSAFNHFDSKVELDCFFKSAKVKLGKIRPRSEPKKRHHVKQELAKVDKVEKHRQPALHRQLSYNPSYPTYNYDPLPRQPVKTMVKSKSDHFKLPTMRNEHAEAHKPGQTRQMRMLKLCEDIQAGLGKGHRTVTTKGMPY